MRPFELSKGIMVPFAAAISFRSYATRQHLESKTWARCTDLVETTLRQAIGYDSEV